MDNGELEAKTYTSDRGHVFSHVDKFDSARPTLNIIVVFPHEVWKMDTSMTQTDRASFQIERFT